MAGLGIFEHDPVTVVSLAGDNRQAVVVVHIQFQIFFVDLGDLLHRNGSFAVDDRHMQRIFQIIVDGAFRDLPGQAGNGAFQKIIVIDDQRLLVQVMEPLHIVEFCAFRETGT